MQTESPTAKLFLGLLASSERHLDAAKAELQMRYGDFDVMSPPVPFSFTTYYNEEMGDGILRQFASFKTLFDPGQLRAIKKETMSIEDEMSVTGKRRANLDPGYVNLSTVVLATRKDAGYRVYLGDQVYAQPTLFFRRGAFEPFEWTYPDYRQRESLGFFQDVREHLKRQLRESGGGRGNRAEKK